MAHCSLDDVSQGMSFDDRLPNFEAFTNHVTADEQALRYNQSSNQSLWSDIRPISSHTFKVGSDSIVGNRGSKCGWAGVLLRHDVL